MFGTRLTRITGQLAPRNIDQALAQAAHDVLDWAGGTRIGASLEEFNRRWARRVLHGGPIVLLISDGWEQGDPAALAAAVARIQRRCHRLIWLNPHRGAADFQPTVRGMRAALAHVDDFLAIDSLNSLEVLMDHLARVPTRRSR